MYKVEYKSLKENKKTIRYNPYEKLVKEEDKKIINENFKRLIQNKLNDI